MTTPIPNATRFIPRGFIPTHEQSVIQLSQHRVTLVHANAGAAKTTTLALRIGEALARGLPPEQILALVFTPEAKGVMKSRLVEIGIPSITATRIHVYTFDEFAADILKKTEEGVTQIKSAKELKPLVLEAMENVSDNYVGKVEFLDIQTHNIAISQFLECQLQLKATMALQQDDLGASAEEIAEQLGVPLVDYLTTLEYEQIRLGGFGDALFRGPFDATYDLAQNLKWQPDPAEVLPAYGLVVADELHDLNEASFRILECLLSIDNLYFVGAGDKDQVIYSRLGADDSYLAHRFNDSYASTVRYPLTMTYRHGPHLAYAMEAFKHKPVDSSLPFGTDIVQLHYGDNGLQEGAGKVVQAVNQWKKDGFALEVCAILLRDRHQSVPIENALMRANIGYRMLGMESYLLREEILFLRGMMAIVLNNLVLVESPLVRKAIVESLAIFAEVDLTPAEMEEAKRDVAQYPEILVTFFSGHIKRHENHRTKVRVADTVAYMMSLGDDAPADSTLREICSRMDLESLAKRIYIHPHEAAVVTKSVDGFINAAQTSGLSLRQFSEWIGAADAFVSSRRSKNLVMIECVSNSKGKEFDHVILPFLENGEFPSVMQDPQEEENLFYVGATRAKTRLTLISPEEVGKRSSFIKRMQLASTRARADAAVFKNQSKVETVATRVDLDVPYADKDEAKALGAQWDTTRRTWFVKAGSDLGLFARWLAKK